MEHVMDRNTKTQAYFGIFGREVRSHVIALELSNQVLMTRIFGNAALSIDRRIQI